MFENESIFLTLIILAANAGILVIVTTPGFAVNIESTGESSKAVFLDITPSGLQFWDNNGEIDTNHLFYEGTQSTGGSWIDAVGSAIGAGIETFFGIDPIAVAKAILQFILFMIFGYVFLMQLFGMPAWFIFLIGIMVSIIQAIGVFYIITYAINYIPGLGGN